jgi:hypothetical protein
MLKIIRSGKLGGNAIPAQLTTLSISWLNNQFRAVAVHRGVPEGTWENLEATEINGNFEALIAEAVKQTGYRGTTVSMLLAHPRLVQQLVDLPPVKGAAVKKIIQRQAQQQKIFSGEAAWACQNSLSGKDNQRVVLHLFPKALLDKLVQGCLENDLHLTSVLPASAVLHQQLTRLPADKEEVAMLAAETGGSTTVVIGRSDGRILLARTSPGNWNEGAERLALDLNRTILFVNQQYGVTINKGVWLFGPGAEAQVKTMESQMQLPVKVSPVPYEPTYWATEALKLAPAASPNFISLQLQQAPQREVFAKVIWAATAMILLISAGTSIYAHRQAAQEEANLNSLRRQAVQLQTRHQELQKRNEDLDRKERLVNLVTGERPPPVPSWMLGYLSEAIPPELVVTNLHIKREDDVWKLQLTGTYQASLKPPTPAVFSNAVALLTERLTGGPFHLTLVTGAEKEPAGKPKPPGPASAWPTWITRMTSAPVVKPLTDNQFVIAGVMK